MIAPAPPTLDLGGRSVGTLAVKTAGACQVAYCHECDAIVWTVSHPYWGASTVAAMHESGTGHRVRFYVLDLPEAVAS